MDVDLKPNDRESYTAAEAGGYYIDILPMIYNHRVVVTPKEATGVYDAGWCYPNLLAAVAAVRVWNWDRDPEPVGYIKQVGMTDLWVAGRRMMLLASTDVAAQPPTPGDMAVLVDEEDAEAGEDGDVAEDARPEEVPEPRRVGES